MATDSMSNGAIHNCVESVGAVMPRAPHLTADGTPASTSSAAAIFSPSTEGLNKAIRHIYLHIPFCARICPYCAFYKERADSSQAQRFCEAILRELERADARVSIQPQTIFFGGGTPTALTTAQLELLLSGFRGHLNLSEMVEWTVEANPGSVSPRKAELLRRFGVNRISLGVQSWNDELLGVLGREHNAAQAETSFRILRDAGFANLNIDLMFGVPGQTLADWQATLAKTIALQPEHISTYCLTYEEDTEFFIRQTRGELRADPDADAEFFQSAMQMLERTGYEQYEISNYARGGYASVHNRAYWAGENYLGLGPSAYSTVEMERWQNVPDYRAYSDRLFAGQSPITSIEALTPEMKRAEKIALSLRTQLGVPIAWLDSRPNERDEFIALGLLAESSGNLILTRKGTLLA
ncbi:MAG: radical SAM family heme chaperone HemW, partial [Verrucomicrobiota bacterium]|nr:radical SAM family heme chaperone HemW [Verrucomicrobiota bacterium]